MKNFILVSVAILLALFLVPIGISFNLIEVGRGRKTMSNSFRSAALAIDILGNVLCADMLNAFFIKKGGYHFGKQGETISSALGKNQLRGTLTGTGQLIVDILDAIDPNHCINAIQDFQCS